MLGGKVDSLAYLSTKQYLQAMKQSFARKGVGADMLISLFKDILIHFRAAVLAESPLSEFSEEELLEYFMKQLTYPGIHTHSI